MNSKLWFVTYEVREHGAIGVFQHHSEHIEAGSKESALECFRQRFEDRFEFGSPVSVKESKED